MAYTELPNSSFMDFTSWRSGGSGPSGGPVLSGYTLNVALILDRANDPSTLLNANWASRQKQLDTLNDNGTLWSTYGADPAKYNQVLSDLAGLHIKTVAQVAAEQGIQSGYVSSAESRTIWVQVDQTNIDQLFGPGFALRGEITNAHWDGNLSLPDGWASALGVKGVWFDTSNATNAINFNPVLPNPGNGTLVPLQQGWQSLGNASTSPTNIPPQQIADNYYNFPLSGDLWNPASGIAPQTGTIGLVEPSVGATVPKGSFGALLNHYRAELGINTPAQWTSVAPGGEQYPTNIQPPAFNPAGERSLDVGVVTAINPQSPLVLYAGSGTSVGAQSNGFTAYQSAFWDHANNPSVITSSFGFTPQVAPGSPFYFAGQQLFIDAALRNITVFNDAGDGGSSNQYGNGLTNVGTSRASPYAFMVGGTTYSTVESALADSTLTDIVSQAMAHDRATVWQLMAGGLTDMPNPSNLAAFLVEAVWNNYYVTGTTIATLGNQTGYQHNNTGSGGVDPSRPAPWYQTAFGLDPRTSDPSALPGRGVPDVSADAGGNMKYMVPGATMETVGADGGTSAATPLWAALASQIDTIFHDQGLPNLGYANDLFYIAAAIAPGGFNDVTLGSNTSSFVKGGIYTSDSEPITPTGYGYHAGPGYDLVTGLGTPNGTLVARAVSAIGHAQMYSTSPAMLDADGSGWDSGADQSLMFQTMSRSDAAVHLGLGTGALDFTSGASGSFAWTMRLAQQSLQSDFDPNLVRMFDKYAHGWVGQTVVGTGETVSVSVDGSSARAFQGLLTSDFGFADFVTDTAAVRVARPVAVAETAGGANDVTAIVRLRQNGENNLKLSFYKVDDLAGTVDGKHPGEVGYEAAAAAHSYQLSSGGTEVNGPGYGNYGQTGILKVDAGDIIAMKLVNTTTGAHYWAFANANEQVDGRAVGHLWNYGLNTWGWEDQHGGGDHDYNDLLVQLDFTSSAGHGWLIPG
jgi:hypothetical protein